MTGEGLQHADGHSHLLAATNPASPETSNTFWSAGSPATKPEVGAGVTSRP
ncbi:hypothetical protein AB0R12_36340 [Streptomyces niveus]